MRSAPNERHAWRLEERRKEARFSLIPRVGVLEQDGRTSFCLVTNISMSGLQLRVYTHPRLHEHATIRVADEQPVSGRIAWINGDNAGLSLDGELDAATLLRVQQKLRPNKRRALPRVGVNAAALLRTGDRVHQATVHDISSRGARIRAAAELELGDRTIVEFADLPAINAYVRWSEGQEAGLAFETPIPMQIIAHWIVGRAPMPS